jgi:DNA-binding transcriptional LysR family regulator
MSGADSGTLSQVPLPPWVPDLASLELLVAVAELGSVGRAARAHGISQPGASARLAHLERRLGVELLVRTRRGTVLTPAGQAVLAWSHDVVNAAQVLVDGVLSLRTNQHARLRVAASLTVAEYLLPGWLLGLRLRQPDLRISASVANSEEVCAAVRRGEAELGFVEAPDLPDDLTAQRVGYDHLALVVAASYPLAHRAAGGLRASDLVDQPLLLREPGSGTRDAFLNALAKAIGTRFELPHATELGSTTTILSTARAGGGIGVVSSRAVAVGVASGEFVELLVDDLRPVRPLTAVWLGRRPSMPGALLLEIAQRNLTTA